MKPIDLLKKKPIKFISKPVVTDLGIYETELYNIDFWLTGNDKITVRFHLTEYGRGLNYGRDREISSVWFDNYPVMICYAYGRDLSDKDCILVDKKAYKEMLSYLITLAAAKATWHHEPSTQVVSIDEEDQWLNNIYNSPRVFGEENE